MAGMDVKITHAVRLNDRELVVCFSDGTTTLFDAPYLLLHAPNRMPTDQECPYLLTRTRHENGW